MNPNNLVCRTCLTVIPEGKIYHSIDQENGLITNVKNIREVIMFCVPEMDLYVSVSPVVCEPCVVLLINAYNFKIRCLRVENAIRQYAVLNNLMEGSCVNLNNVLRHQVISALQKNNWPNDRILAYVDGQLSADKMSSALTTEFRDIFNTFHLPRATCKKPRAQMIVPPVAPHRPATMNRYPPPPYPGSTVHTNVSQNINVNPAAFNTGTTPLNGPNGNYVYVSRNLMPPRVPAPPFPNQQLIEFNRLNSPPISTVNSPPVSIVPSGQIPPLPSQLRKALTQVPPGETREFQNAFLSSLQLISTENEGAMRKKTEKKRQARKAVTAAGGAPNERPLLKDVQNKVSSTVSCSGVDQQKPKGTGLRGVRRKSSVPNSVEDGDVAKDGERDLITIMDDDDSETTAPCETLIMNFDDSSGEGDVVLVPDVAKETTETMNVPPTEPPDLSPTEPSDAIHMNKKITVNLPKLAKETLRRKLTPEDVIEEILSKRRKLTVKLDPSLPYLHRKKRLKVVIRREQFLGCRFCQSASLTSENLRQHHLSQHLVCSLCGFVTDKRFSIRQHVEREHPAGLAEALENIDQKYNRLYCFLCDFTGTSVLKLKDHRIRQHVKRDSQGAYLCPYADCNEKNTENLDGILAHIEKAHDTPRLTQCPLCNFSRTAISDVKRHVRSHDMTRVLCHLCGFSFKSGESLEGHMRDKHPPHEDEFIGTTMGLMDLGISYPHGSDDYGTTLDSLRCSAGLAEPSHDSAPWLPSLPELLCTQTFVEESSDQEDDCTIVSDERTTATKPDRTRRKAWPVGALDTFQDCFFVSENLPPTVDVSDDDTVIEIHDHDGPTENTAPTKEFEAENSKTDTDSGETSLKLSAGQISASAKDNSTENIDKDGQVDRTSPQESRLISNDKSRDNVEAEASKEDSIDSEQSCRDASKTDETAQQNSIETDDASGSDASQLRLETTDVESPSGSKNIDPVVETTVETNHASGNDTSELTLETTDVESPSGSINIDPVVGTNDASGNDTSELTLETTDVESPIETTAEPNDALISEELVVDQTQKGSDLLVSDPILDTSASSPKETLEIGPEAGETENTSPLPQQIFDDRSPVLNLDPIDELDTEQAAEGTLISVLEETNSIFPESRVNFDSVLEEFDITTKDDLGVNLDASVPKCVSR